MNRLLPILLGATLLAMPVCAQQLTEGFDLTAMPPAGWTMQNNSDDAASAAQTQWFSPSGTPPFTAFSGSNYAAANFNATGGTTGSETISAWLISPDVQLADGVVIRFYTRSTGSTFADRLQVRMNTSSTVNVGTTATDVGDFTDLLLDINPNYDVPPTAGAYPDTWTAFAVTVSGVTGTVTGKIAFRYFVENGGPSGTNSDFLGLDEVEIGDVPGDPEVDVQRPLGPANSVSNGATYEWMPPLEPGSTGNNFDFEIVNQGATQDLTISNFGTANVTGCAVNVTTTPTSPVGPGNNTSVVIDVDLSGFTSPGLFSFDITFNNNDTTGGEDPYTITVSGTRGLSGTYSIDAGGGGDYLDFGAAFTDLESFGVAGAVTFQVAPGTYTPDASYELGSDGMNPKDYRPVFGTSSTNTITFEPSSGQPVISNVGGGGNNFDYIGVVSGVGLMSFTNVGHVTFRGFRWESGAGDWACLIWNDPDMVETGPVNFEGNEFIGPGFGGGCLLYVGNGLVTQPVRIVNNFMANYEVVTGSLAGTAGAGNGDGVISFLNANTGTEVQHNSIIYDSGTVDGSCIWNRGGAIGSIEFNAFHNSVANAPVLGMLAADVPLTSDRNVIYTTNNATVNRSFPLLGGWQGQGFDTNSSDQDPQFLSSTSPYDLHIPSTSPAVDLAVGSTEAVDIDGEARPFGSDPDAGADENQGGATPNNPTVTITATDASAAEATPAVQTGTYELALSPSPTADVTVNFSMSGTADTGQNVDYDLSVGAGATLNWTGGNGSIVVSAGTTPVEITLTPFDDAIVEQIETATMTIVAGGNYSVGNPDSADIDILDNDGAGNPVVTVSASGNPDEAGPTPGTFHFTASPVPAATLTVNFTLGGTATEGVDYNVSAAGGTITIDGSGTATMTITPIDDTEVEGNETVVLTISPDASYTVGTPGSASLTIVDNDQPLGGGNGGGGGGGGCAVSGDSAPWLVLLGLLFAGIAATRRRLHED